MINAQRTTLLAVPPATCLYRALAPMHATPVNLDMHGQNEKKKQDTARHMLLCQRKIRWAKISMQEPEKKARVNAKLRLFGAMLFNRGAMRELGSENDKQQCGEPTNATNATNATKK